MLRTCDGCKDVLDTDQDGSSVSTTWGSKKTTLSVVSSPATPPKERKGGESGCIGQILGLC